MGPEFAPPPPPPQSPASAPYPPYTPEPPRPRRLSRSRRERMWAGVAGGMAEYFDLDPNLVRLLWVAGTILSHGVGVAVYILLWVILPRDDSPRESDSPAWRNWSEDFHAETQRLAHEARRVAEPHRYHGHHSRSTGVLLVALGVVLLAANAGVFNWINWATLWPVILIGLGILLLARRSGWGR